MAYVSYRASPIRSSQRTEPASAAHDRSVKPGALWWQLSTATGRQMGPGVAHEGEPIPLEGGEPYANRVAEQVMQTQADASPREVAQAGTGRNVSLPPTVQQMVDGPAQPLDSGTRAFM